MARTVLFVHAHPDDEVLASGATMAHYAARGDRVVLVTCTLGELGEVVQEELKHLAAEHSDELGEHRAEELREACRRLGVSHAELLGGQGRWRDSGMVGESTNQDPRSFWRAAIEGPRDALVQTLRRERPDAVVTYNSFGGYGHPDHIKAHQVVHAAVAAAADGEHRTDLGGAHDVPKVYEMQLPVSFVQRGLDALIATGAVEDLFGTTDASELPFTVPDDEVSTMIDARESLPAKKAAMLAHRSQISDTDPLLVMCDVVPDRGFGVEFFQLVKGELGPRGEQGYETDLFAGLS